MTTCWDAEDTYDGEHQNIDDRVFKEDQIQKFKEVTNSQDPQAKKRKMEALTHYWTGFSQKQKLLLAFFGDGCLAKTD